jgi:hypothetical protein
MNIRLLAVAVAGINLCSSPSAQAQTYSRPNEALCPQKWLESEDDWSVRCHELDVEHAVQDDRRQARQQAEIQDIRATVLKQPALPANRNRLLGRWQQANPPAAPADLISQIAGALSGNRCELMFGGGTVEFRSDRWIVADADGPADLGPVAYREGNNGVFVLPEKGLQLMAFSFDGPDRVALLDMDCKLKRVTASAGQASATPKSAAVAPPSQLLTLDDLMGYQCPNGQQPVVLSCYDSSDAANCGVVYMEQPRRNGYQVNTNVTRGAMLKQVSRCKVQKVRVDQAGNVVPVNL